MGLQKVLRDSRAARPPVKLLGDRILVRPEPDPQQEELVNGLVRPVTTLQPEARGEVIAVGPGKVADSGLTVPMPVQVGDTVMYGRFAGSEIAIDGQKFLMLREPDVFLVVQ